MRGLGGKLQQAISLRLGVLQGRSRLHLWGWQREVKSWCPSGQRTIAQGGIGQLLFRKGKSVARAVGGFVYKLLSCCCTGPMWLMHSRKLTHFPMQLRGAFSAEGFVCCIC